MRTYFVVSFCLLAVLSVGGCTGVGIVTGAAAVTGIAAAQEGGLKRAYNDTLIKAQINEAWFQYNVDTFSKLETTINQGRVLITGVVQDPEHRVEAVRLAWQVKGVQQVINEIRVAESEGVAGFVKDSWITSKLRANLTFDRGVQSVNYSIDTVQGIVYLMGVAQNQMELNRVIETARTIKGVKQVVSYVKLSGEALGQGEGTTQSQNSDTSVNAQESGQKFEASKEPAYSVEEPQSLTPDPQPSIKDQYYNS